MATNGRAWTNTISVIVVTVISSLVSFVVSVSRDALTRNEHNEFKQAVLHRLDSLEKNSLTKGQFDLWHTAHDKQDEDREAHTRELNERIIKLNDRLFYGINGDGKK